MPTFLNNKINVLHIRFGGLILPSHFWDEKNKNPSQIRDAINTNLIKFLPYSELCSMFNNKANSFDLVTLNQMNLTKLLDIE